MRSVYSRFLQTLNIDKDTFIISERTLRLEAVLEPGRNNYELQIKENPGSDRPLERKLNQNDGFVISHIGLGITRQDESGAVKKYGNFPIFNNPDPNYFVGAQGGNTEAEGLYCIYNGDLSLKTNNTELIQQFNLLHTLCVPERGYTKLAAPQVADELPQFGPNLESKGFYPYSVNQILNGQDNNTVSVNLGKGSTALIDGAVDGAGAAVNTRNVLVVFLHGYEIAEAAQSGLRWGTF